MALPVTLDTEQPSAAETIAAVQGELSALRSAAVDAVTDTRRLEVHRTALDAVPTVYDRVQLYADTPGGRIPIRLLEGAHEQLAGKLDIPLKYYQRMLEEAPDLLSQNINHWHQQQPGKRLLRMLKPISEADRSTFQGLGVGYAARAVLSDRYRTIDHGALFNTVLPVAEAHHLSVTEWKLTDRHFYVRFKAADQQLGQIVAREMFADTRLKGDFTIDDILAEVLGFGAALRNSETGHGAFQLDPMFEVKRCLNRIIVDYYSKMRVVHVGGRQEEEDEFYQADTKALDNAAVFLKVRDRMQALFTGDAKVKIAAQLAASMGTSIVLPEEVGQFEFISNVAQSFDLTEQEQKVLKEEVLAELQFTGRPLTPFTVSQGLTATARRIGTGEMERKVELERLGWKVLADPVEALIRAGKARVAKRN